MGQVKELLTGLQELQQLLLEDKLSYLEIEQLNHALEWTFPLLEKKDE